MKYNRFGRLKASAAVVALGTIGATVLSVGGITSSAAAAPPPLIPAIDCSQTYGGNYLATIDGQINGIGTQATVTLGSNCTGSPYYLAVYVANDNLWSGVYPNSQESFPSDQDFPQYIYPQSPSSDYATFSSTSGGPLTATINLPNSCWQMDVFSFAQVAGSIPDAFTSASGLGFPPGIWAETGPFTIGSDGSATPATCSSGTSSTTTTQPGGLADPLTIGYWKHWNSYTLGAMTDKPMMDTYLPQSLGGYQVATAQEGVAVLQNASATYAENSLAAQLLAAELDVAAGAPVCSTATNAIAHANALLQGIGYAGPPSAVVGSSNTQRTDFIDTANTLNTYNNNQLC